MRGLAGARRRTQRSAIDEALNDLEFDGFNPGIGPDAFSIAHGRRVTINIEPDVGDDRVCFIEITVRSVAMMCRRITSTAVSQWAGLAHDAQ